MLKITKEPLCPICGEECDTSLRSALAEKQRKQFGRVRS